MDSIKRLINSGKPALDLSQLGIYGDKTKVVFEWLQQSNLEKTKILNLAENGFNHEHVALLGSIPHIEQLNLAGNNIGDEGVIEFAKALTKTNSQLKSVNLQGNGLSLNCIDALLGLQKRNIEVDISDNAELVTKLQGNKELSTPLLNPDSGEYHPATYTYFAKKEAKLRSSSSSDTVTKSVVPNPLCSTPTLFKFSNGANSKVQQSNKPTLFETVIKHVLQ